MTLNWYFSIFFCFFYLVYQLYLFCFFNVYYLLIISTHWISTSPHPIYLLVHHCLFISFLSLTYICVYILMLVFLKFLFLKSPTFCNIFFHCSFWLALNFLLLLTSYHIPRFTFFLQFVAPYLHFTRIYIYIYQPIY